MGTLRVYPAAMQALGRASLDLLTSTVQVALLDASYTWSAAHTAFSDVTGELSPATGYRAGGYPLTGRMWEIADTAVVLHADDLAVPAGLSMRSVLLYVSSGMPTASGSLLIAASDLGADVPTDGNPLTAPDGWFRLGQGS